MWKGMMDHQYEQTLLFWCTSHLYVSPALPGAAFSGICCSPGGSCTRFLVPWGPVFNPRSWDHGFSIRTSVLVSLLVLVRAGMTNWIKGQDSFGGGWWQRVIALNTPSSQWFAEWCRSCNRSHTHTLTAYRKYNNFTCNNKVVLLCAGELKADAWIFPSGLKGDSGFVLFIYLLIIC